MITRHDDHVIGFIVRLYGQNRRRRRFSRPRRSRPLVRSGAVELEMKQDPRAFGSIDRSNVRSKHSRRFCIQNESVLFGEGEERHAGYSRRAF